MKAPILLALLTLLPAVAGSVYAQESSGLRKLNGTTLYVSTVGSGENLVVVHGGPGLSHDYFRPHLDGLAKDFQLVYFDQRASGRSALPADDSISIRLMVDDIEALRKDLGLGKINLLGHSWGAVLATHYALTYPGHMGKLIYSNPSTFSHEYDSLIMEEMQNRSTDAYAEAQLTMRKHGAPKLSDYETLFRESFKLSAYDTGNIRKLNLALPENFPRASRALHNLNRDPAMAINLYDSVKQFDFPVLIIFGLSDLLPLTAAKQLEENIAGAKLVVFRKSGHFPFVEEQAMYLRTIREFLKP